MSLFLFLIRKMLYALQDFKFFLLILLYNYDSFFDLSDKHISSNFLCSFIEIGNWVTTVLDFLGNS